MWLLQDLTTWMMMMMMNRSNQPFPLSVDCRSWPQNAITGLSMVERGREIQLGICATRHWRRRWRQPNWLSRSVSTREAIISWQAKKDELVPLPHHLVLFCYTPILYRICAKSYPYLDSTFVSHVRMKVWLSLSTRCHSKSFMTMHHCLSPLFETTTEAAMSTTTTLSSDSTAFLESADKCTWLSSSVDCHVGINQGCFRHGLLSTYQSQYCTTTTTTVGIDNKN